MALLRHNVNFPRLTPQDLEAWRLIPPAVASDCMNRTQVMHARIKPILAGQPICGQARTAVAMAGDCSSLCEAIALCEPGDVIVADAGGIEDTAVWGGVMTFEAVLRKLGGAVIDGSVRDVAEIKSSGLPIYCRAVVPRGPHHGFGGVVDGVVSVAGVSTSPGDVVLGNDDGIVVVPLARQAEVLAAARLHLAKEEVWLDALRAGRTIKDVFGFADAVTVR